MFSLKLDYFFPDLQAVKELARKLNASRQPRPYSDPREVKRLQDELRAAREQVKAQAIQHRYHVF